MATFDNFDDQVSDMIYLIYRKTLICSSGDGSLLVIDTKKNKIISRTESLDDEITCLTAVKVTLFLILCNNLLLFHLVWI